MKISIITVVYNNEELIESAINSVTSQTYKNIEYIIVDGESKDGTCDIINKHKDVIDKFISEPDKGIYDAMNKGIVMATGDVVGILNSDDIYASSTAIESVMNIFENEKVDSVYGDLDYVSYDDINKISRRWRTGQYTPGSFLKGWHPAHPAFFVKKNIYDKYGTFDISFEVSADFELMLRFMEKNRISSYYLPEVIVKMREGGESNRSVKNILLGQKNIRRAFKKNGIDVSLFYTPKRLIKKAIQKFKK